MDDDSCRLFVRLMSDEMPGKNNKTQNIGLLFNSDMVVEGYFN